MRDHRYVCVHCLKFRTNEVLNEVFGKKKQGRKRKCQGKYYECFDPEVQRLKREAGKILRQMKQRRRKGEDSTVEWERYRVLNKEVQKRHKVVRREQALKITNKLEELKLNDPKGGWRLLKQCLVIIKEKKNRRGSGPVIDAMGTEHGGAAARKVVRETFAQLAKPLQKITAINTKHTCVSTAFVT